MYLSVRRISGRVKYLNTWPECQATPVSEIIKKIDHMENELRMDKQSVISNLEKQMKDLKSSLVYYISKTTTHLTYACAVLTPSQSSEIFLISFTYEMGQSVGGRKREISEKKHPHTHK